eukprot:4032139-Prymnesium_polylepis.1
MRDPADWHGRNCDRNAKLVRISRQVAAPASVAIVPHIVTPAPLSGRDLRGTLNIPEGATVFCRYGGPGTFDIEFAKEAVRQVARSRADVYFLFAGTDPFSDTRANIVHLRAITEDAEKHSHRFIRTCDAMLHARRDGESFGMAVAEFSVMNKPVFTYAFAPKGGREHLHILGDKAF